MYFTQSIIKSLLAGFLIGYLLLVRRLRFQRRDALLQRFHHLLQSNHSLSKMSSQEARQITQVLIRYDCPYIHTTSLSLALFQTYAIPSISKLLARTGRLVLPNCVGRRAEDTLCLLTEVEMHGVDSQRGSKALARTNFLHSLYGPAISRDDLLFTLSLFILEPIRMTNSIEWRTSTDLENQARFVLWSEIGNRMGISDLPDSLQSLIDWSLNYRSHSLIYAESNAILGEATMELLLRPYPSILRPLLRQCVLVLIPDDVRQAFGWDTAKPSCLYNLVPKLLALRAFLIRHLALPRRVGFDWGLNDQSLHHSGANGESRIQRNTWLFEPFYVVPSLTNQIWGLLLGFQIPSSKFQSEGYVLESLGPDELSKLGTQAVLLEAERARMSQENNSSSKSL